MDRLLEVVDTLSKASSCGDDSTLSSVMESISEIYWKQRELKINLAADKSIPSKVIMNKATKTSNADEAGKEQTETTLDKIKMKISLIAHQWIRKILRGLQRILRKKMLMVFKLQAGNTGHPQQPLNLHQTKKMPWEMHNSYTALTSLGTTPSRGPSPKKSPTDNQSPQKKKSKVNLKFSI
jgi:hypothetical protein